ncbi:MAG: SDR family oxidoreductase [Lentisphaerae bacterium]|nr:SDR family oxidoreductase [Lentisphaerota bacterium]
MAARESRHVLVIGGCGYIGSILAGHLLERGCRVRVLDRLLYGNGDVAADWMERNGFSLVTGDLCDGACLAAALEGVTDVLLPAAIVGDPACKRKPEEARRVNEAGAISVFDALAGRGIDRFVFFSTCSNYGLREDDTPADEDAPLHPLSLYAETKVAVERHILAHADDVDFHPTVLRLATAYGLSRRMRFDLTVSDFTRELALGRELVVYDEGTWRPYCHVRDIARAVTGVLDADAGLVDGRVYNVGGNDENYTKQSIVDRVVKYVPDARVCYRKGGSDPRNYRVAFDRINAELGFSPAYSVDRSVQALVAALEAGLFADVEQRPWFYGNTADAGS